jgi:hypothetical protein
MIDNCEKIINDSFGELIVDQHFDRYCISVVITVESFSSNSLLTKHSKLRKTLLVYLTQGSKKYEAKKLKVLTIEHRGGLNAFMKLRTKHF